MLLLIEAIAALEKMSDCSLEDGKDVTPGCEDIHGLICLAAQLAFEVTHSLIAGHVDISEYSGGAVAQRLESWFRILFVALRFGIFGNSVYPALPVSFGGDTKSRRSLLSGVYARGIKIPHTGGKCITCCELQNSEINRCVSSQS